MPTLSPARPALLLSSRLFLVDRIGRVSRTTASIFTLSLLLSFAALFGFELIPELNASVGQASRDVAHLTRVVGGLMVGTLKSINAGLVELPWYVFACLVGAICIIRGKIRLSIFSMVVCAYIFSVGYWNQTMSTVAMIIVALPIALVLGAALGLCAYYVPRLRQAIDLVLDFMQVVPALAYIIPLLVLFGFGPAPGIIASFVFAAPSMARNVMLALSGTPTVVMEATTMNGATRFQTLMLVQVPIGMRQLSLGLNQTVMAILAMTVFAATVGGVEDLGWSVLLVIRKADFGESVICGIVITLFAVILDRVSEPSANRPAGRVILIGLAAWVLVALASVVMSSLGRLPVEVDSSFLRHPLADQFNFAIATFTEWVYIPAAAIKNFIQVWLLLPMRLGALYVLDLGVYDKAGWPSIVAGFVLLSMFAVAGFRYSRRNPVRVMIVVLCAVIYLGGLVTLPWFVCLAILTVMAFLLRGPDFGFAVAATLLLAATAGLWNETMTSLYLVIVALFVSIVLGFSLALSTYALPWLTPFVRSVMDLLQTIPQFVIIIPVLFLYQIGEVTAVFSIMLYAIGPMVRYTELGLKSAPADTVEACYQMGCTPFQIFWHAVLPSARTNIVLGVNQTAIYALAMVVAAAIVGSRDLGQAIFVALGRSDVGLGLVSGLIIALLGFALARGQSGGSRSA